MHYITTVEGYEDGSYEVDGYESSTIPGTTLPLYINCGTTLVVVNNGVCPTHLSLMPEATCSIKRPIRCASMPEVIEMVALLSSMSHMLRGDGDGSMPELHEPHASR